jgi:hypothetical protein
MKKINIDNFNWYKEILALILNLYKKKWENKFILYTLKQDENLLNDIISNLLPIIYKFKSFIFLKLLGFPFCIVWNYKEDFTFKYISWYIWRSVIKLEKECIKCLYYDNCLGIINNKITIKSVYKDIEIITFKEFKGRLNELAIFLKKHTLISEKPLFFLRNININSLKDNDFINFSHFKYISLVVKDYSLFIVSWKKNLFFKSDNFKIISSINTNFSFCFTIDPIKRLKQIDKIVSMQNYNLYINCTLHNKNVYRDSINYLKDNIYIINNNLDLKNTKFYWKCTNGSLFSWTLKFLNLEDIDNIKKDFENYIIYVNDNINYFIPDIYKFKYFISQSYNSNTHFAIISREIWANLMYNLPYDFLLNLKSWDLLNVNYKTWEIMEI